MDKLRVSNTRMTEAVRALVMANPDTVYRAPDGTEPDLCLYVHASGETGEMTPGCLIGQALNAVGVPLEDLAKWEGFGAGTVASALVDGLTFSTLAFLDEAQFRQDLGETWREAYNRAANYPAGIEL